MGRFLVEDRGEVRILTLENAQKRNALDVQSLAELEQACAGARRDHVRCLVVRGAGEQAFSSGFDLSTLPVGAEADELADLPVERAMAALEALPCATVALVNGHAFGAGCELAATCDLRIARAGVLLGMPPAKLGVVYAPPGLRRFLDLVGPSRTREMFFTGRPIDADRALAIGLLDRVLPSVAEAEAAVLDLAREIASNAPLSISGTKRILQLLQAAAHRALTGEERREVDALRKRAFESRDAKEGRDAFLEKRPPVFRGE